MCTYRPIDPNASSCKLYRCMSYAKPLPQQCSRTQCQQWRGGNAGIALLASSTQQANLAYFGSSAQQTL